MYSGGVTNGKCVHAPDSACNHPLFAHICSLACCMVPVVSNDRCSHQHDSAWAEVSVIVRLFNLGMSLFNLDMSITE